MTLKSAGTLPPTVTSTTSPGTSSPAGSMVRWPWRSTVAASASYALRDSIAFSALVSVMTPTVAVVGNVACRCVCTYAVHAMHTVGNQDEDDDGWLHEDSMVQQWRGSKGVSKTHWETPVPGTALPTDEGDDEVNNCRNNENLDQ